MTARREQDAGRHDGSVLDHGPRSRKFYSWRAGAWRWVKAKVNRYLRRQAKWAVRLETR